jgi:hypothetical protein
MWLDNTSQDAIDLFWRMSGVIAPFPRDLESAVLLALPIAIIKLPRLRVTVVEEWLSVRGAPHQFGCAERRIRGCLVAFAGKALIFLDGTDTEDERRFTLAHEIAHFLVDYWLPRQKALAAFGMGISEVLDGRRPATPAERLNAVLVSVAIGVHINLMERHGDGVGVTADLGKIENKADRIALALLAPPRSVLSGSDISARKFEDRRRSIADALVARFGLPATVAAAYSRSLLTAIGKGPTWAETIV